MTRNTRALTRTCRGAEGPTASHLLSPARWAFCADIASSLPGGAEPWCPSLPFPAPRPPSGEPRGCSRQGPRHPTSPRQHSCAIWGVCSRTLKTRLGPLPPSHPDSPTALPPLPSGSQSVVLGVPTTHFFTSERSFLPCERVLGETESSLCFQLFRLGGLRCHPQWKTKASPPVCLQVHTEGRGVSQGRLSAWPLAWGGGETSGLHFLSSRRGTGRCEALRPLGTAQPLVHSGHADDLDSKVIATVTTGGPDPLWGE